MNAFFSLFKRIFGTTKSYPDFISLGLVLILFVIGCFFIYGIGQQNTYISNMHWKQHLLFGSMGLMICFILSLCDYRIIGKLSFLLYAFGILLLVLIFVPGIGKEYNNARCWLGVPGSSFNIQPSELVKSSTLLFTAWVATRKNIYPWIRIMCVGALIFIPTFLILLQPDLGTVMVFGPMLAILVFLQGISWKWISVFAALALIATPILFPRLSAYQRERVYVSVDVLKQELIPAYANQPLPKRHATYQINQTRMAIGSGGFVGKGFMNGKLHILGHVPKSVAPSDLIFSVIGEEGGFVLTGTILGIYILLILRCLQIAYIAKNEFGTLLCAGVAGIYFCHVFINVGMNLGVTPTIGIPLPFVSHGGSAVLGMFILLGLVQSVYRFRTPKTED